MPINVQCSSCRHALWDDAWGEYRCKKKQRSCNETELAMGCDRWEKIGSKPSDPKPEIVTRSGATFYPSVSRDGVLSWTNDKDLPNPRSIKIKGKDGYTPVKGVDYFDGADGKDGFSPTVSVEQIEGGNRVNITDKDGMQSFDVMNGVGGGGGGVSSWNDLTDKPFGEMPPAFDIQWDGVIGDKFALDLSPMGFPNMYAVKVSDSVFTAEELDGALLTFSNDSWSDVIINSDTIDTSTYAGALNLDWVFIVYDADSFSTALGTPEGYVTNGTYFICIIDENYPNRFVAPTTIKKLDNKYLDLEGFAKSVSWNDLTDKPFGEIPPAFDITWDGNMDGHENFQDGENAFYVKVSDEVFTKEQLLNSTIYYSDGYDYTLTEENIYIEDEIGVIVLSDILVIFSAETFIGAMGFPEGSVSNGVWFVNYIGEEPYYTNRFVASYTIKTLDNKYLDLEGYAKTEDLPAVAKSGSYNDLTDKPKNPTSYNDLEDRPNLAQIATSGSWNDLTDRPFGTSETSWVLLASGTATSSEKSIGLIYNVVGGKNYKLEVVDPLTNMLLISNVAPATMGALNWYNIGNNQDAVYGSCFGGSLFVYWTVVSSGYGYKVNVYEEREVIKPLDEKFLPDSVVLESELEGKGYQTEEQVMALINEAISNLPKYNGEVEDV